MERGYMTLGEMQVEAKKHKWDAERLPSITASTPKAAMEEWVERSVMLRLLEVAEFANRHKVSLDVIAGKLGQVMR